MARAMMIHLGFMLPNLQVEIPDPLGADGVYRVDYYWELPSGNVAGELDGKEKYWNPQMTGGRDVVEVLADERLRESRLTGANVKVMRFAFKDVRNLSRFRRLLTSFGIPSGFEVPRVARYGAVTDRRYVS